MDARIFAALLLLVSPWLWAVDIDREVPSKKAEKPSAPKSSEAERALKQAKKALAEERRKREQLEAHAKLEDVLRQAEQAGQHFAQEAAAMNIEMIQLPTGIAMGRYEVTQG